MTRTAHGQQDLLLLGGLAALVAMVFIKTSTDGSGGGGGGEAGGITAGEYSGTRDTGAPIIYQFPGDGSVSFPNPSTLDLAGLLSMFGGAGGGGEAEVPLAKKETTMYDAGQVLPDGTVLPKPFTSVGATKTTDLNLLDPNAWNQILNTGPAAAWGSLFGTKKEATVAGTSGAGGRSGTAAVNQLSPQGAIAKSDSAAVGGSPGFSRQYIYDAQGNQLWSGIETPSGELAGLTKKGAWQRDVFIYGPGGQVLYNPETGAGNPMFTVASDVGRTNASRQLDFGEVSKVLWQQNNWSQTIAGGGSGGIYASKKEAVAAGSGTVSSGPAMGSPGSSMESFMSSAMAGGQDYQSALNSWAAAG